MRKTTLYLTIVFVLFLNACSLNEDVAKRYKQELPLRVEVMIPETFSKGKLESIDAVLTQNGERVVNPGFVHFEIWKQDGSVRYPMEEAEDIGDGTFRITKDFEQDGLYFVKVHASSAGSTIIPTTQFVVGNLSASDIEYLEKGMQVETPSGESHH